MGGEGERSVINGAHDTSVFQSFLDKYVLCENCRLPEIDMIVKKGVIIGKCKACGWSGDLDNAHKLATYIIKNPPDDEVGFEQKGKGDKKARQAARAEKARKAKEGGSDDEDAEGSRGVLK